MSETPKPKIGHATSDDAGALAKLNAKGKGKDIQGDPDEWDYKNIQAWLALYEKAYPGRIRKMSDDIKVELALSGRTKDFGEIDANSELRLSMWLPADLQEIMEAAYPTFWTNKKHLAWFLNHFPVFKSAPKH